MIHETDWQRAEGGLYEVKHFWAQKGLHTYVATAHRTFGGIGDDRVPTGNLMGAQFRTKEVTNTEEQAKKMVEEWLAK